MINSYLTLHAQLSQQETAIEHTIAVNAVDGTRHTLDLRPFLALNSESAALTFYRARYTAADIRPEGQAHIAELVTYWQDRGVRVHWHEGDLKARGQLSLTAQWRKRIGPHANSMIALLNLGQFLPGLASRELYARAAPLPGDLTIHQLHLQRPLADIAYETDLHEFGHLTLLTREGARSGGSEVAAAMWSLEHARYWTRAMSEGAIAGLASYTIDNELSIAEFRAAATRILAHEVGV